MLLLFRCSFSFSSFEPGSLYVGCSRTHHIEQAGLIPTEIHLPLSSGWVLGLKAWGTRLGGLCLWRLGGSGGYCLLEAGRLPCGDLTVLKQEAVHAGGTGKAGSVFQVTEMCIRDKIR